MTERLSDYCDRTNEEFVEDTVKEITRGIVRGMDVNSAVKRASNILNKFLDAVIEDAVTRLDPAIKDKM
jgi:hypothetical protein